MNHSSKSLFENDIEWESSMCIAEQFVTDAVSNNINGLIKKQLNNTTFIFNLKPKSLIQKIESFTSPYRHYLS